VTLRRRERSGAGDCPGVSRGPLTRQGTYSIVAFDPASSELGVAVQSHWFSVGSVVCWARPGVGAVATQAIAQVAHGPGALQHLAEGLDPAGAIEAVLREDVSADYRQLGAVDAAGRTSSHTGRSCIAHAGARSGEGFSCQANMMAREGVPDAMADAYSSHDGDLAERLLAALDAGESAGGDLRGQQSAALLVVPAAGEAWRTRFDLRVDDHVAPLSELRRLLRLARAYELADRAEELLAEQDASAGAELYRQIFELAPDSDELTFWAGIGAGSQDVDIGAALIERAASRNPSWLELLERLPSELAPSAASLRAAIAARAERAG
jgi:uncharacterized Ntn-hydrolase superfamily protein